MQRWYSKPLLASAQQTVNIAISVTSRQLSGDGKTLPGHLYMQLAGDLTWVWLLGVDRQIGWCVHSMEAVGFSAPFFPPASLTVDRSTFLQLLPHHVHKHLVPVG